MKRRTNSRHRSFTSPIIDCSSPIDKHVTRAAKRVLATLEAPVSVVGSINADLTVETQRLPKPGETVFGGPLATLPGGKSANQAVTCALLGAETKLIGALGTDAHGDLLLNSLTKAGVEITGVQRLAGSSGSTLITVDEAGENTIVYSAGANTLVDAEFVRSRAQLITSSKTLGLCLEAPVDAVHEAARIANETGVEVVLNYSPITALPDSLLKLVDVLIVNEHELVALSGSRLDVTNVSQLQTNLTKLGFRRVALTMGANGSLILDNGEVTRIPAFTVKTVDTTGAGDSYMGSLLAALAAGASLADGACLAAAVSALATTGVGAQSSYHSAKQVRDFLTKYEV
uniref:ribokinase n=1 Tax=Vaginimicrobium propionicum TaxID=1871034 RepID=UPI001E3979C6|nr:ribokinase [Vaginimicrobium propionicum]